MLCDRLEKSGKVGEFCFGRPVGTLKNRLQQRQLVGRKAGKHGVAVVEPAVY